MYVYTYIYPLDRATGTPSKYTSFAPLPRSKWPQLDDGSWIMSLFDDDDDDDDDEDNDDDDDDGSAKRRSVY
jgi:hypothetical protein